MDNSYYKDYSLRTAPRHNGDLHRTGHYKVTVDINRTERFSVFY